MNTSVPLISDAHIYEEYTCRKPIRVKQHLTMAFKKSPQTNIAANSENISAPTVALKSDLVPKHENFDSNQGFNDLVDFTMNDKREFPSVSSIEKKSYFATDLVMQNTDSSKYEDLMPRNVDLYTERRSVCNNNNNTRHRQQRTMKANKIPRQETNLGKKIDGHQDRDAFKVTEIVPGMKTNSWQKESENSFDEQIPLTAKNDSPNFVKNLESFVDSVRRLENNRLVTNCRRTIFSKEILPVKSVTNHSLIPQHRKNCTSPGPYAHGSNDYAGLPLDLSQKSRKQHSERPTNQFKPLLVGDPSEISSLKHLEEKFGANSTILEYIGAQSNATSGSKSSRFSSEISFAGRCYSQRLLNSTIPSDHSAGTVPPALDKIPSHLSANNQAKLLSKSSTTETQGNVTGCSDDFQLANSQYPSQYLHAEALSRQASVPCSLLRCSCGAAFGLLSLLMIHLHESGHRLFGTRSDETKSPPTIRRQRKRGFEDPPPYIPQCVECGGVFQSLPELTFHMIQTAHFMNLVVPSMVRHHRPSSVCSASTLDSLEGNEERNGLFEARVNALMAAGLWPEIPLRTVDFPWSDLESLTVTQSEYMSQCANAERFNRLEFGLEQTSAPQIQSLRRFAPVKLETDDSQRHNGRSSDFSSDGRSCYSSPSFKTDLEMTETSADSNLNYTLQNGSYNNSQNVVHSAWSANQTSADGSVSALVAMQDFVHRSFSSSRNSDLGRNSVGHNKWPAIQFITPEIQWQVPKSACQKAASPHKRKRSSQAKDLKSSNPSDICPGTVHPKRKGTGKSRNLSYWGNVSTGGGKRSESMTSELLRNRRIKAWQRLSVDLFNNSTSNRIRPSSVDDISLAKKHATTTELIQTRKRHHSVDFQTVSSTDDDR